MPCSVVPPGPAASLTASDQFKPVGLEAPPNWEVPVVWGNLTSTLTKAVRPTNAGPTGVVRNESGVPGMFGLLLAALTAFLIAVVSWFVERTWFGVRFGTFWLPVVPIAFRKAY